MNSFGCILSCLSFLAVLLICTGYVKRMVDEMPQPFSRELRLQTPPETGKDVIILQNLLQRHPSTVYVIVTSQYDVQTAEAVKLFQRDMELPANGVFCMKTALKVLEHLLDDGFKDDRKVPAGYSFKLYVPVHKNRNIETVAMLLDQNSNAIFNFTVRAHGRTNEEGIAINQLSRDGNTPTGLSTFDLNSKEPYPKLFGPYPVLRVVKGLKGNSAIGFEKETLLSNYRSGILLHTGKWQGWEPSKPMPNSLGCMHCSPDDMKKLVDILVKKLKVKVNENPFGKLPYPYKPQGLIAIEQID